MRHKTKSGHYIGQEFPSQTQLRRNYSALIRKINSNTSKLTAKQKHTAILKLDGITRQEMDSIIESTGPKLAISLRKFVSAKRLGKIDKRNIICALKIKNGKLIHVEGQYEWSKKWNKKVVTFAVLRGTEDAGAKDILRKQRNKQLLDKHQQVETALVDVTLISGSILTQRDEEGNIILYEDPINTTKNVERHDQFVSIELYEDNFDINAAVEVLMRGAK